MTLRQRAILALNVIGLLVSGYLTYTHLADTEPICGGFADCSYVQASSYATILGIPVALLGLGAYLVIFVLLIYAFKHSHKMHGYNALQIAFGLSVAGVLYSAYLTYIEAFVLHAYCLYCVTSAIAITLMTLLLTLEVFQHPIDKV